MVKFRRTIDISRHQPLGGCSYSSVSGQDGPRRRPPDARGSITVICGCMFSGKTTELIRRIGWHETPRVLAVKHRVDTRYRADQIVSHGGLAYPGMALANARDIFDHLTTATRVVAVDEAHFFDMGMLPTVRELAARGIHSLLTLLDRDSWGRPFAMAKQLRVIADEQAVQYARCARCGARADHTQRLTPIVNDNMVGGVESYEPRCRECWSRPPEPPPSE